MPRDLLRHHKEWILQRNCSLSRRQMALAYGGLCLLSLGVAGLFAWHGAWPVLWCGALEQAAVGLAFLYQVRHAADHEHIVLDGASLLVEVVTAGVVRRTRLAPDGLRVALPRRAGALVALESRGERLVLGRFVSEARRRQFALELQRELLD